MRTGICVRLSTRLGCPTTGDPQPPQKSEAIVEQFLVLVTCRDEKEQVKLLGRFVGEGLKCRGLVA